MSGEEKQGGGREQQHQCCASTSALLTSAATCTMLPTPDSAAMISLPAQSLSTATTDAPWFANLTAAARPMPDAPPVT